MHLRMEERSPYMRIEEVRMNASQCEEGCFKAIEGNAKEYQIHDIEFPAAEIYSVWDSQVVSEPVKNSELEEQTNPVITLHPSKLNMSGSHDEIPPPPPPLPSSSQTPTQQIPHTTSTIKLPILKKGEYDIWAMKMEHYLAH
ncbi:hypothetical protein Tco_1001070, partial [Tanacetum coccineum]